MGAACPFRRPPGYKLLQSVSLRQSIQQCLPQYRSQSVSNNKSTHFINYSTWRCISLQYFVLRYSYLNLQHVKHIFCELAIRWVLIKKLVNQVFFSSLSVAEPFATNISVVIGVEPTATTTKRSFVVYAERVTEDTGRPTVKNYSSS